MAGNAEFDDMKLLFGFYILLSKRILKNRRRIAVLRIIAEYPDRNPGELMDIYLKKTGETIAQSTLTVALKELLYFNLIGKSRRLGTVTRAKVYRTTENFNQLCDLPKKFGAVKGTVLAEDIALFMGRGWGM